MSDFRSEVQRIADGVARYYHLDRRQVMGRARMLHVARARHVAMYLVHSAAISSFAESHTLSAIGRAFRRDRTTVLHAVRQIDRQRRADATLLAQIRHLQDQLCTQPIGVPIEPRRKEIAMTDTELRAAALEYLERRGHDHNDTAGTVVLEFIEFLRSASDGRIGNENAVVGDRESGEVGGAAATAEKAA